EPDLAEVARVRLAGGVGQAADDLVGDEAVVVGVVEAGDLDGGNPVPPELVQVDADLDARGDGRGARDVAHGAGVVRVHAGDARDVGVVDRVEDQVRDGAVGLQLRGARREVGVDVQQRAVLDLVAVALVVDG